MKGKTKTISLRAASLDGSVILFQSGQQTLSNTPKLLGAEP